VPASLLAPAHHTLDASHDIWCSLAEPLRVERGNELRQRLLPSLLVVVVQAAKFLRVHSELTGHLHMSVRQVMSPPRLSIHTTSAMPAATVAIAAAIRYRPPTRPGDVSHE
jgi:hypothetical protein